MKTKCKLMCRHRSVLFVGFRFQNLLDLLHRQFELLIFRVEVRRYPNACAGSIVDKEITPQELRSHLLPVALLQDLLSPVFVALEQDHVNRRTADTVRQAGVEVISIDRWLLGFFNLIIGRAPRP